MEHLSGLNEAQKKAVLATDGPVLVIAGAGAGKTRVITQRILHLIHTGIAPREILAVTFTNKAATEMKDRVEALLGETSGIAPPDGLPTTTTFHSFGVRLIRAHAPELGIPKRFNIYDRGDSVRLIKQAQKALGFDPKQFDPRKVLGSISKAKGNGEERLVYAEKTYSYFSEAVAEIWERYQTLLREARALDFDDLLVHTHRALVKHSDIRDAYQKQFPYIHVDEYQDTNKIQFEIVKLLAGEAQNVFVVGDVDQSIYSWRGATIENILSFERVFPRAQTFVLEQNYRSTKRILETANKIIEKNKNRPEKNLHTENEWGDDITLYSAQDERGEALFVAESIRKLLKNGVSAKEIAVLYRTNFQSRVLEEHMLLYGIPYQVLGTKFFERKEIKDALSLIRASLDRENIAEVSRIINVPPRGIGKVTLLKIATGARDALTPAMKKRVDDFFSVLRSIQKSLLSEKPSIAVAYALKTSGLFEMYRGGDEDDLERLANLKELVSFATKYDTLPEEESCIDRLLEDAALATDQDSLAEKRDAVRLMTVHTSKGLEFEHVFITGLEAGLFPSEMGEDETRDKEEERRLFYVALTRARKKLFLSHALMRTIFGNRELTEPSEFLLDIGLESFEHVSQEEDASATTIYLE